MLSRRERLRTAAWIAGQRLQEYVRFDSKTASFGLFLYYTVRYGISRLLKGELAALSFAGDLFRHTQFSWCRRLSTRILRRGIQRQGEKEVAGYFLSQHNIPDSEVERLRESIRSDQRPFDGRLIILSPPAGNKRGVLLVKFTPYFPMLLKVFDTDALLEQYVIVLEPSFCGYFHPSILCMIGAKQPILVQASERVDFQFLDDIQTNLLPVNVGANFWINEEVFYPIDNINNRYDIIMVSIWSEFKRHYHLFYALSKCKNKFKLKVCLVGMPFPLSVDFIVRLAYYYDIYQNIDIFEDISQDQLNRLINESKLCLLLSKKEGFNKSIIESMYADVPAFILRGLNYGEEYEYINNKTGGFIDRSELVHFLENLDAIIEGSDFEPRRWISRHMSVHVATKRLEKALLEIAVEYHFDINIPVARKVNKPECDYIDPSLWAEFKFYYKDLRGMLRGSSLRK